MIQLGDAWLSLERREAFVQGVPVRLGSRAFAVLEVLLASPNRLVTKDELIRSIWPDTVVEENNLQVQISSLRRLLNLDPHQLETVPRRGYRLNLAGDTSLTATPPALRQAETTDWMQQANVHVVDDEPAVCAALVRQLRSLGIDARGYESAQAHIQ
jgi:DNA-binding winged helix-turn-helix (wHTH) protein